MSDAMNAAVLACEGLNKVFREGPGALAVLRDVTLAVGRGERLAIVGASGSGKSTLLHLLGGLDVPTSGRVLINGQDVSHLPKTAIPYLRRNLGLVLQESRLLFDRNVFDNVMLPLVITGHPPRDAARRVAAALERVGLAGREREMPAGLSGGEQQRVAIARAIVNRPSILIADEPTAHLDAAYAREIAGLFKSFNEAGVTILVSTHDERLFMEWRPRRLVLGKGLLVRDLAA